MIKNWVNMTSIRETSIAPITDLKEMKIYEPSDKELKNNPLEEILWPMITHGWTTNKIRKNALKNKQTNKQKNPRTSKDKLNSLKRIPKQKF